MLPVENYLHLYKPITCNVFTVHFTKLLGIVMYTSVSVILIQIIVINGVKNYNCIMNKVYKSKGKIIIIRY